MSPLLQKVLDYLQTHGPQNEDELLEAFGLKRSLLTRLFKEAHGQLRQQGEYLYVPGQEERVSGLQGRPVRQVTSYVILDTETTSTDRAEARLLEVAALKIQEGQVIDRLQLLVCGERVPRFVTELTGITQEAINEHGQPLPEVLRQLQEFIADLPVVGHNILGYDAPLLRRYFREQGLSFHLPVVLDTLLLAPLAFAKEQPPVEGFGLEGLHAHFCGDVHEEAHRALADCEATFRILGVMIQRLQVLPPDERTLLGALPVPELSLAFEHKHLTVTALTQLSARLAGTATGVSAIWNQGRQPRQVGEMLPQPRPGQLQMAESINRTLTVKGRLVVEAPTGTGKTRAYLYPALLQGRPGRPVVISTYTKQLQSQIVQEARDLADDGFAVQVVALKGQSNYLCPDRLHLLLSARQQTEPNQREQPAPLVMSPGEARALALFYLHVTAGEYDAVPSSSVTRSAEYQRAKIVTSTVARRCHAQCSFAGACSYYRTNALVSQAQVVVVNHALLLRNHLAGIEQEDLPFERVVIDEAHDLQEAAFSALRREVSSDGILSVAREFLRRTQGGMVGILPKLADHAQRAQDEGLSVYVENAIKAFDLLVLRVDTWQAALQSFALQYGQGSESFGFQAAIEPLVKQSEEWRAVQKAADDLKGSLKYCAGFLPRFSEVAHLQSDLDALLIRLNDQIDTLTALMQQNLVGAHVYAVHTSEDSSILWAVPLWLSSALEALWEKIPHLVFTSATLRVPGTWEATGQGETTDFGVFQRDIALPQAEYMVLPPVLPYEQGHVMLTNHMPLVHHPDFPVLMGQELNNLLAQTPHQSLHIFTANERLRRASRHLAHRHLNAVRDGIQRTVHGLRHATNQHALGSAGFLQGVDIRDLSLVSLDKTPFPIPDLILEAQRRDINDFETYWSTVYLPRAVLKFVQGFGRLIRNNREGLPTGAFVVWDKRLAFAHYQDRFLGALPVPPQNVHRARNRDDFYRQLGQLWDKPLTYGELIAPKMQAINRYREALHDLQEPERRTKLEEALGELFEFPEAKFRKGQYEGVVAALDGIDVLAVLPTGAGKSLIFQLPAVLGAGYTIVISPLVALIQDQVTRLQQLGLPAAGLWGGLSRAEQESTLEDVLSGRVKLLYLAPERIRKSASVRKMLASYPPERVVYDEAHTLLEWGHDFRPDYLYVQQELVSLGVKAPVSAFTATATPETRRKLIQVLAMDGPERIELGVRRDNLYYEVIEVTAQSRPKVNPARKGKERKPSRDETLITMLAGLKTNEDTRDGRAIVYVGSRKKAERLAAMIGEIGIEVAAYHAKLSPAVRTELLEQFQAKLIRVMVATKAFGMGIDAPDIHLVVHYDAPLSLEEYVQEAGRAGRDPNIQARAVLLWNKGSEGRAKFLIEGSYPDVDQAQSLLNIIKNGPGFPTLSELGQCEGVDLNTLPTLLHLLEVSGAIRYNYVPGLCRVYPYYGVELPNDPMVRELVERTRAEPIHLSRKYRRDAPSIEDRLMAYQRDGKLGVMLLEPALTIDVRQDRVALTNYDDQVRHLKQAKYARFDELKRVLLDRQTCRGYQLQLYFERRGERCGNCDVCDPGRPAPWSGTDIDFENLWNPRKELLRLLWHLDKQDHTVGRSTLVRILRNEDAKSFQDAGTPESKTRDFHWKEKSAPNFGKLRFVEGRQIREELDALCQSGLAVVEERVFRTGQYPLPVVVLTERGRAEVKQWSAS